MSNPTSLAFRVAVVFSLSLAASPSSLSFLRPPQVSSSLSSSSSPSAPGHSSTKKATASDLLSLLGTPEQALTVDTGLATQLRACFKFLVPFSPNQPVQRFGPPPQTYPRRALRPINTIAEGYGRESEENERVWRPPASVLELARLAADSGGDPDAIYVALDSFVKAVPDIERSKENRCELTRTPYCTRFIDEELNLYLGFLFELIVARGPSVGLQTSLTRYDFFHGHLIISKDTKRLGILFHAKEYPAPDKEVFPYNMGYCQKGSNVTYDDSMNFRNILWLAPLPASSRNDWSAPGVLVVLDANPEGIIYKDLIPEYVKFARTLYEDDFGDAIVDVNYLNVGDAVLKYDIFIC